MILANGAIVAPVRPGFPWNIQHTDTRNNRKIWKLNRPVPLNYEIPMDFHHIIPWNVLRDGWSALATSQRWEVLTEWMGIMGVDNIPARITDMIGGILGMPHTQDMWEKLCWSKWNLVEGPRNDTRTDDPGGGGLDAFHSKSMPNNLRGRSLILMSVYTHMRNWAPNLATLTKTLTKPLLQDLKRLKPYKNSPIHMFDDKTWEMVSAGRIDQFGLAVHNNHPTWKKKT